MSSLKFHYCDRLTEDSFMSDEEVHKLRLRVQEFAKAYETCYQENARLQNRVSELYNWSQEAQNVVKERDNFIQTLTQELNMKKEKERERLQKRSELTLDELYERVQQLETINNELKEMLKNYYDILESVYLTRVVNQETQSRIEESFRRSQEPQKLLIIELAKELSVSYSDLISATGLTEQEVKLSLDPLINKGLVIEFGQGVAAIREEAVKISDPSGWNNITNPKELFISLMEYVKISNRDIITLEAVKRFRDILQSLIGTPVFIHEISESILDIKMQRYEKDKLVKRINSWMEKWEQSINVVEVRETVKNDPSLWDSSLTIDELFSSMKRYANTASNEEIASALEKIHDILYKKHGHAIYLVEIKREAAYWKKAPQKVDDLVVKLIIWRKKAAPLLK